MASATRTPGQPALPAITREEKVAVRSVRDLRQDDVVLRENSDESWPRVSRKITTPGTAGVPSTVTLVLTDDEANAVQDVLRHVGGGQRTRRSLIEGVNNALHAAGVVRTNGDHKDLAGAVYFK